MLSAILIAATWLSLNSFAVAQDNKISFSACPLIGTYYPPPSISRSQDQYAKLSIDLTKVFQQLVEDGSSKIYGSITPNTTSFSVVLFSGDDSAVDDPVFFKYTHTSPRDQRDYKTSITQETRFPLGDVTMVFTVYAWLIKMSGTWDTAITEYLPELKKLSRPGEVSWTEVTIGSLAGQMSGLVRQTEPCTISKCERKSFVEALKKNAFLFRPDTTPAVSFAAYQLLALAMQRQSGVHEYASVLNYAIFEPLNMTSSGMLGQDKRSIFASKDVNLRQPGEPGALSLVTSMNDLARAGHAMLSSRLVSGAETRRWLQHSVDTSNLRNGVGRPWEIYRASSSSTSPIVDAFAKAGTLGPHFASYFGLTPDLNAGFAILAHDAANTESFLDLNVYADIVVDTLSHLQEIARSETVERYAGRYQAGHGSVAVLNVTSDGPGLAVQKLSIGGSDIRAEVAHYLGISDVTDLDFRLYPSNIHEDSSKDHFVAIFQDKGALIDAGTPTCTTWQDVGSATGIDYRFVFKLAKDGTAKEFGTLDRRFNLKKVV